MSGVSYSGGVSRCFPEWQRFVECYTAKRTDDFSACQPFADDYGECLHHRKEKARASRIAEEINRRKAAGDDIPTATAKKQTIEDLGLVKE